MGPVAGAKSLNPARHTLRAVADTACSDSFRHSTAIVSGRCMTRSRGRRFHRGVLHTTAAFAPSRLEMCECNNRGSVFGSLHECSLGKTHECGPPPIHGIRKSLAAQEFCREEAHDNF